MALKLYNNQALIVNVFLVTMTKTMIRPWYTSNDSCKCISLL